MSQTRIAATVSQQELELIAQHRREIHWRKVELEKLEKDAIHLILMGADVEQGCFAAKVKFRCMRNPAWKKLVLEQLGQEVADAFKKTAKLNKVPWLNLTEHPPLPLLDR